MSVSAKAYDGVMAELREAKAEIARLRPHGREALFTLEEFEALQAEIARLTAERDEWQRQHDLRDHRCFALAQRAENAEAEIARLRDVIRIARDALRGHDPEQPYMKAIRAALKPDTGEQLIAELHVSGTKEEWLAALAALNAAKGEKP